MLNYYRRRELSPKALDQIEFDQASIRQIVSGERLTDPETWLLDPDEYEKNGRVLRDSESPRMLAYSRKDRVIYATDGCNACARHLPEMLEDFQASELPDLALEIELKLELLERLASLVRGVN